MRDYDFSVQAIRKRSVSEFSDTDKTTIYQMELAIQNVLIATGLSHNIANAQTCGSCAREAFIIAKEAIVENTLKNTRIVFQENTQSTVREG